MPGAKLEVEDRAKVVLRGGVVLMAKTGLDSKRAQRKFMLSTRHPPLPGYWAYRASQWTMHNRWRDDGLQLAHSCLCSNAARRLSQNSTPQFGSLTRLNSMNKNDNQD